MNDRQRILHLEAEIEACDCWAIILRERALGKAFRLYEGNGKELHDLLESFADGAYHHDALNMADQSGFFACLGRLLHNYVAAAMTLRDHCRVYLGGFEPEHPIVVAARREIAQRFAVNPLARFVQELRNYMLHKAIPLGIARTSVSATQPPRRRVSIDAATLGAWDQWTELGRAYLEGHPDGVPIELAQLIASYDNQLAAFYEWLVDYRRSCCGDDLNNIMQRCEEIVGIEERLGHRYSHHPYVARGFEANREARCPSATESNSDA